jgi:hypothetical protein
MEKRPLSHSYEGHFITMSRKKMIMLGMVIGSFVGAYVPTLFGVDEFSMISILTGISGGMLGIWIAYGLAQ